MRRLGFGKLVAVGWIVAVSMGAAPAAPSYGPVERTIGRIREGWTRPGAPAEPNAPGWNALFDALLADLRTYSTAPNDDERLRALNRLYTHSTALGTVAWPPAAEVRASLREWLRPRVRLAWAERRLVERVKTLPSAPGPAVKTNRDKWVRFVDDDLGKALRTYETAPTVAQRANALAAVHAALGALKAHNQTKPWSPSVELQTALNDLCDRPNFDVSIDVPTLAPVLSSQVVVSGPVYRKGYVSQVTAGPYMGFGLMASDDGIAFFNRQMLTSVTPIWDFQNQMMADPRGKKVLKLYNFSATSTDQGMMTIVAVVRPTGLSLTPQQTHNVDMIINSWPAAGGGMGRAVASLIGMNQEKIKAKVRENAIPPMREKVAREAAELAGERTAEEAAKRNVGFAKYLIGNNELALNTVLIEALSLRSRPENALIAGKVEYRDASGQAGADAPVPANLARPDAGVSADVHLSSVASNFSRGFLESDRARKVKNLMVVTKKIEPGATPNEGVKVTENVDFPAYLHAVDAAREANDPKVVAIRVKRPDKAPEFGVDAKANLVALVNDLQIDVPAPPQVAKGGVSGPPARVYRIIAPQAEFVISFKVEPKAAGGQLVFSGKIESFDPGRGAKVMAIDNDENQATPLTMFASTFVLGAVRVKLTGQPLDFPLSSLRLPGFEIRSVSPLDPSGWVRVNLIRTGPARIARGQ